MSDSYGWLIPLALCLCGVLLVVGVGGGIFYGVYRSGKALNRDWGDLGTRLGLTFKPSGIFAQPELAGTFRQRPLRLYTYSTGTQGNRQTYTAVAVTIQNPNNSMFEITPSGSVGNLLGKVVKAQDVEVGNPAFDARFVVKSNPPDYAVRALGEARLQAAIMELEGRFRMELDGPTLKYSKAGVEENAIFLAKLFDTLSDLADRLEGLS